MKKITRKSPLGKSKVNYGDDAVNHFQGCSHGCTYCYEMMARIRRKEIKNYKEWIQPKEVENIMELLEKRLSKHKKDIKHMFLSFATDPFMYGQETVENKTLEIIERINKEGIKCVVLTKGIFPKRLVNKKYSNKNEYGVTLVSLSPEFKKKFEPYSASFDERLSSLKYLHDQGLKTWVSVEPFPTPNIFKQDLSKLLEKIKFVDKIVFGSWNHISQDLKYDNAKNFYLDCSKKFVRFCEKNGIKYHVKIRSHEFDVFKNKDIFTT